MTLMSTSI